ncbi:MAG: threonine--tRNA ligase [Chlamydiales bacterium]
MRTLLMKIFYNEEAIELEEGSSAKDLAEHLKLRDPSEAITAKINDRLCDLSTILNDGDYITFYNFDSSIGKEVFWHTSAHVLAQAVMRLWPDAKPTIGPPIEAGFYYDFANLQISEEDFAKIELEMQKIIQENYSVTKSIIENTDCALELFKNNPYKGELIHTFSPTETITTYQQGEYIDLCRGPHLFSLGKIKALKLLKTSGAYWKGDSSKEMLTRIYGISFPNRLLLKEYLHYLAEAKKRDHRVIGAQLDLFSFHEESPAMPFIHPKGLTIWQHLIDLLRELNKKYGYVEIQTPQILSKELWELSGHWDCYREHMYITEVDERSFAIKPMNCPGCMIYYRQKTHSHRELPMRIAEFGCVHRLEPSGALNGLFRVRRFHQDDAHLFMKPSDIKQEIFHILEYSDELYSIFELKNSLELSTRPDKFIGTEQTWEMTTASLKEALQDWGKPFEIKEGDGAFYGPKIDMHVRDALQRSWQCGTIQLDMSLPEKFDLVYRDTDGKEKRPIMIHRAIFGSIERFFGIIIEHYAGKFPLWLSPLPVRVLTVADRHITYAKKIQKILEAESFIVDIDDSGESVSKKVRNAQLQQINYMIIIGDAEEESGSISLRSRDNRKHGPLQLDTFIKTIIEERKKRLPTSLFI